MSKLTAYTKAFFNHENYHGWFKRKKFFEGWYFKLVDKTEQYAFAFIPGIAMDENGGRQCFIQVLDGKKVTAAYHKFDAFEFRPNAKRFKIRIKENSFSTNRIKLDLPDIKGLLHFTEHFFWPKKLFAPGIMGWYSFVPFMQCYHQVVSMNFTITGMLIINNKEIDFTGGKGYIEKDWGRSFPSSWIWMQTNHFSKPATSFKLSVAKIPWLTGSFVGFICAFLLKNKLIKFATYTGAKLKKVKLAGDNIDIIIEDRNFILTVNAVQAEGADLATPVSGLMEGRVKESMNAIVNIKLFSKKGNKIIFEDTGRNAGLEIAGKTNELINAV
ncbi:MAG: tocopherol cyclase family protein [Chitinophagales bacterium]